MPRNIVICCDGTNNQFGSQNTNVIRLVQVLQRDPARQLVYYDPGVGTLPEPGAWTKIGQTLSVWSSLAFGTGLTSNVEEAYSFLMDYWEQGDRVFLFGFSRGAYTARVLAGLLHALGLLPRGNHNLVPYLLRLMRAIRQPGPQENVNAKSWYWKLINEFRRTFARPFFETDQSRRFRVHFLGLWDTVSSMGWVWNPASYPFTRKNPSIGILRHAVAVDERRAFFRQNLLEQTGTQDLVELWFPGVHADVGGGYPEVENDFGLWRVSFEWMVEDARKPAAGLHVDDKRFRQILAESASPRPWADKMHDSMTLSWRFAEFVPKKVWGKWLPRIGGFRGRVIPKGARLHESTLRRIRDADLRYAPRNMTERFLQRVRELPEETLGGGCEYAP